MNGVDQHIQDPAHFPNNPQKGNNEYCESCGGEQEIQKRLKEVGKNEKAQV
jgi:hypothetical protein